MKKTEISALKTFENAALTDVTLDSVKAALNAVNTAKTKEALEAALTAAQTVADAVNAKAEGVLALAILNESIPEVAWNLYLKNGTYTPCRIRRVTKKGVTTYTVEDAKDVALIRPVELFAAYKEKWSKLMTSDGYMTPIVQFYWAFVSNKAESLEAAPLKIKEKWSKHCASGNDCEKLMNEAAVALNPGMTFKLYRKNLIAINDYMVKGTVFKAKIGGETKLIDALIRCMMVQAADRKMVVEAKGACLEK